MLKEGFIYVLINLLGPINIFYYNKVDFILLLLVVDILHTSVTDFVYDKI